MAFFHTVTEALNLRTESINESFFWAESIRLNDSFMNRTGLFMKHSSTHWLSDLFSGVLGLTAQWRERSSVNNNNNDFVLLLLNWTVVYESCGLILFYSLKHLLFHKRKSYTSYFFVCKLYFWVNCHFKALTGIKTCLKKILCTKNYTFFLFFQQYTGPDSWMASQWTLMNKWLISKNAGSEV